MSPKSTSEWLDDDAMRWLMLPLAGILGGGSLMATTLWLGRGLAGGGWVWPSLRTLVAGTFAAATGARIDVWMLNNTDATRFVAPLWFWALAFALLMLLGAVAAVGWQATALMAADRSPKEIDKRATERRESREQRAAAKDTLERQWPIKGPYRQPKNPGPGVLLGRVDGRHAVAKNNTPVLVLGPTGTGKTRRFLAPNAAHWPGPLIMTSVKPDVMRLTVSHRLEQGRVFGFDPTGRFFAAMRAMGIEPVVWDPVRMLQASPDRENDAVLLATFMMSQTSAQGQGSQEIWATLAKQVMTRLLVLSIPLGADLHRVLDWVLNPGQLVAMPDDMIRMLSDRERMHLRKLQEMDKADERIWDSIKVTMEEVADSLRFTSEHPEVALCPVTITADGTSDTLYMVSDLAGQNSHRALFAATLRHVLHNADTLADPAQQLYIALQALRQEADTIAAAGQLPAADGTDEVINVSVETADDPIMSLHRLNEEQHHTATPHSRPESPLFPRTEALVEGFAGDRPLPLFVFDELTNLAPLPDMDQIIATIRASAQVITGIQEGAQLARTWGEHGKIAMFTNHPTRVQLAGSADAESLRNLAELSGLDATGAAKLRMIDQDHAIVLRTNALMFEVELVATSDWIATDREVLVDVRAEVQAAMAAITATAPPPETDDAEPSGQPATPPPADTPTPASAPLPPPPAVSEQIPAGHRIVEAAHADMAPAHTTAALDPSADAARSRVRASNRSRRRAKQPDHDTAPDEDPREAARRRVRASHQRDAAPRPAPPPATSDAPPLSDYEPGEPDFDTAPPPAHPPKSSNARAPNPQQTATGPPDPDAAVLMGLGDPSKIEVLRVAVLMLRQATAAAHQPTDRDIALVCEMVSTDAVPITPTQLRAAWTQFGHAPGATAAKGS